MVKKNGNEGDKVSLAARMKREMLGRLEDLRRELKTIQEDIAKSEAGIEKHEQMKKETEKELEGLREQVLHVEDTVSVLDTIAQQSAFLDGLDRTISDFKAKVEEAEGRRASKLEEIARRAQVVLREISVREGKAIQEEAEQLKARLTEHEDAISEATQITRYIPEFEDAQQVRYNAHRPPLPELPRGLGKWI